MTLSTTDNTNTSTPTTEASDNDAGEFTWWACSYTADERPHIQLQRPTRSAASSTCKGWLRLTDSPITYIRLERRDRDGNAPTVFASFKREWKREA